MKVGDIVKIKRPYGGYWKGKITKISDTIRHPLPKGHEMVHQYSHPIATVEEIGGSRYTLKHESDLKRKFRGFVEK